MAKKSNKEMWFQIGRWSYVGGLVIALLAALFGLSSSWIPVILFVLGIVVGFLNISAKEEEIFLIAAIAFLVSMVSVSSVLQLISKVAGISASLMTFIGVILGYLVVFATGATIVVSIKALYKVSKDM